jgi:MFS family permease
VINAFLITFGSFLLLAGRLGDLIGRKRVFLAGVLIFTPPRCCAVSRPVRDS